MKDILSKIPLTKLQTPEQVVLENSSYINLLNAHESDTTSALVEYGFSVTENPYLYIDSDEPEQLAIASAVTQVISDTYTSDTGEYLYPLPINNPRGSLKELRSGHFFPRLIWNENGEVVALTASIERKDTWIEIARVGKVKGSLTGQNLSISPIITASITDALRNRNQELDRGYGGFYAEIRVIGDRDDGIFSGRWIQSRFLSDPRHNPYGYDFKVAGLTYLYCVGGNEPFLHVIRPFSRSKFKNVNSQEPIIIPPGPHETLITTLLESMELSAEKVSVIANNKDLKPPTAWIAHIPPNQSKIYWQISPFKSEEWGTNKDELLTAVNNGEITTGSLQVILEGVQKYSPFLLAKIPADQENLAATLELMSYGLEICGIIPKLKAEDNTYLLLGKLGNQALIHGHYQPQLLPDLYNYDLYTELSNLNQRLTLRLTDS